MNKWPAMLVLLITLLALGCSSDPEASSPSDSADPSPDPSGQETGDASTQGACSYRTPRCGPRNCIAMCVTCFYDHCRAAGRSCSDCKWEMERCKYWCRPW